MSQQSGRDLIDTAPSVTCVIGAYNHAKYVVEALDSAFALTYPNLRIIIYDDASTDNTQQVIRDHLAATGRDDVLFVAHEQNKGLCASLNEMLALVNSDYVAFISADDLQVPERLSIQVERLEALGERYAMIYSNALR
ncbi:MAG: glycosyltransferase family 2 protein, partial [Actinobacteria bacterium]|nr:glycosyltransferase family 2 protein [Actinomycetota bacterium]